MIVKSKSRIFTPTKTYDFPVKLLPLKTDNGIVVDRKAVYRSDLKKVIAVVGSKYKLIPHKQVLKQIEENLPVVLSTRKVEVCKAGAFLFANYESNKIAPVEPRKGDIVKFGIQIINSYNGRLPVAMRLYAVRLVCTNGLTAPKSVSTLSVKHMSGANIIEARKEFDKKIVEFVKYSKIWTTWAHTKPSKIKMEEFLKARLSKGGQEIVRSKFKAQQDDTVWGFYNALTWYGTHVIKSRGLKGVDVPQANTRIKELALHQFAFDQDVMSRFYHINWN
jgi:Domain of unknown function (DUF932)